MSNFTNVQRFEKMLDAIIRMPDLKVPAESIKKIEKAIQVLNAILKSNPISNPINSPHSNPSPAQDLQTVKSAFEDVRYLLGTHDASSKEAIKQNRPMNSRSTKKRPQITKQTQENTGIDPLSHGTEYQNCRFCYANVKITNLKKHEIQRCPKRKSEKISGKSYDPPSAPVTTTKVNLTDLPLNKKILSNQSRNALMRKPPKMNKSNTPLRDSRDNHYLREAETGKFDSFLNIISEEEDQMTSDY